LTDVVTQVGLNYVGGTANATINGGLRNNVLDGSAGGDTLNAGTGNQVLIGGPGDSLKGGLGIDTFVSGANFGLNTVKFFVTILQPHNIFLYENFLRRHDRLRHSRPDKSESSNPFKTVEAGH